MSLKIKLVQWYQKISGSRLVAFNPGWALVSSGLFFFLNTYAQAPLQTHWMRILEKGTQAFVLFKMLKLEVTNDQPGLRALQDMAQLPIHLWHVILMIN